MTFSFVIFQCVKYGNVTFVTGFLILLNIWIVIHFTKYINFINSDTSGNPPKTASKVPLQLFYFKELILCFPPKPSKNWFFSFSQFSTFFYDFLHFFYFFLKTENGKLKTILASFCIALALTHCTSNLFISKNLLQSLHRLHWKINFFNILEKYLIEILRFKNRITILNSMQICIHNCQNGDLLWELCDTLCALCV